VDSRLELVAVPVSAIDHAKPFSVDPLADVDVMAMAA
jgi:hypothetical protein